MTDDGSNSLPSHWTEIAARTSQLGFDMPSEPRTAALLQLLAASKPGGRLLEIGTGTGLATAALLSGMDAAARLWTVDVDETAQAVARAVLGHDPRVSFVLDDGVAYLGVQQPQSFDLIFADAMPGKYQAVDAALALVRPGGFYIGDDMLPQDNWPIGHQDRVDALIDDLRARDGWHVLTLAWGCGFVLAVREGGQ